MQNNDEKQIMSEYWRRQGRQLLAIAVSLFLVILMAVVYKRSDLFGDYSGNTLISAQLVVIISFIAFTALNWRCPACKKYLGSSIKQPVCRHCRTRLR